MLELPSIFYYQRVFFSNEIQLVKWLLNRVWNVVCLLLITNLARISLFLESFLPSLVLLKLNRSFPVSNYIPKLIFKRLTSTSSSFSPGKIFLFLLAFFPLWVVESSFYNLFRLEWVGLIFLSMISYFCHYWNIFLINKI